MKRILFVLPAITSSEALEVKLPSSAVAVERSTRP